MVLKPIREISVACNFLCSNLADSLKVFSMLMVYIVLVIVSQIVV